jgi:hypothetical protein
MKREGLELMRALFAAIEDFAAFALSGRQDRLPPRSGRT